jgi:hypothetical protein
MLCGAYLHDVNRRHSAMRQLPQVVHLPAHLGERSTLSSVVELLAEELAGSRVGHRLAVEALLNLLFCHGPTRVVRPEPERRMGGRTVGSCDR